MKIEEQIKRVIEEQLHVKIRHDGETLFDMGADGVDLIELERELEGRFHIRIKFETLTEETTVRDIIRLVKKGM